MAQLTIVFGLVECVFGWLQLLGFAASGNSMYPATGTFYNPGPYCGFLAVITPVALHAVLRDRHRAAVWLSGNLPVSCHRTDAGVDGQDRMDCSSARLCGGGCRTLRLCRQVV